MVEDCPNVVVYQAQFVFCPDWNSPTFEPFVADRQIQGDVSGELLPALVRVLRGRYPLASGRAHTAFPPRLTSLLLNFGSSSCSQIATRLPARTSFGR